jgi:DNA end-binding protein Ku
LYSATEGHDVPLHQVHEKDGGRIHYERRCEVCNEVVQFRDIDKAYEEGGTRVMLTDDDLKTLPAERDREIEVVEFVPGEQVDPLMFDRSYYLEPDSTSPKSYVLLRRTLEATDRMAIVRFAMRQKTHLAALRVRDDVLVLQTLLWSDEVRDAEFEKLSASVKISEKELALSQQLVESFSGDFEPQDYVDEYQVQLRELIARKAESGTDVHETDDDEGATDDDTGGEVIDLMEALRRSVDRSRSAKSASSAHTSSRAQGDSSDDTHETPDTATSSTARRTASTGTTSKSGSTKSGSTKGGMTKSGSTKAAASKNASSKRASTTDGSSKAAKSSARKTPVKKAAASSADSSTATKAPAARASRSTSKAS